MRRRQSSLLLIAMSLWLAIAVCAFPPNGFCRQIEQIQSVDWARYAAVMGVRSNDAFGQTLTTVLQ